jgi:hypothetical protein
MLTRLKMTDAEVVRRRAVGQWRTLGPLFAVYGAPANSDYFPFVDQRAGKTRFTRARVDDLVDLLVSPVPLLEMLDGAHTAPAAPHDVLAMTMTDLAADESWRLRDVVMGVASPRQPLAMDNGRQSAAHLARSWSHCTSEITFDVVLPALAVVASLNPHLDAAGAGSMWQAIERSPCGRRLKPEDQRWIALFDAAARRSADGMAQGRALLETPLGPPSEVSEYALLAAVTGLICRGEPERARILLEKADNWVRPGQRLTERRYLAAMLDPRRQVNETATCKPKR